MKAAHSSSGHAHAHAHHGEVLQGAIEVDGGIERVLITLPWEALTVRATYHTGGDDVRVTSPTRSKARDAAVFTLDALGAPAGGTIELAGDVPQRLGLGSSTADVVATIRAVAAAHSAQLTADEVASLAVRAEHASDATMYDQPVLFAQRVGRRVETLADEWPPMLVLGCLPDPGGIGIDTLSLPLPRYDAPMLRGFAAAIDDVRAALASGDVAQFARACEYSASISQRFLPTRRFGELQAIARDSGACGVQVSHSGPIAGMIFGPAAHAEMLAAHERIGALGLPTWQVAIGGAQPVAGIATLPTRTTPGAVRQ